MAWGGRLESHGCGPDLRGETPPPFRSPYRACGRPAAGRDIGERISLPRREIGGSFLARPPDPGSGKSPLIPDLVTSSLPTVALRVPDHPLALSLIRESGRPIAAPSANPFGGVSPTTAEHVRISLGDKVDLILDGGPSCGVESTVLSLTGEIPVLLRPGGVRLEELQKLLGEMALPKEGYLPQAPGQLPSHYAP